MARWARGGGGTLSGFEGTRTQRPAAANVQPWYEQRQAAALDGARAERSLAVWAAVGGGDHGVIGAAPQDQVAFEQADRVGAAPG